MSEFSFALVIISEVVVSLFIIWGFMHEDKFIRFEDFLWKKVKKFARNLMRFIKAIFITLFVSDEEVERRYNERRSNF